MVMRHRPTARRADHDRKGTRSACRRRHLPAVRRLSRGHFGRRAQRMRADDGTLADKLGTNIICSRQVINPEKMRQKNCTLRLYEKFFHSKNTNRTQFISLSDVVYRRLLKNLSNKYLVIFQAKHNSFYRVRNWKTSRKWINNGFLSFLASSLLRLQIKQNT